MRHIKSLCWVLIVSTQLIGCSDPSSFSLVEKDFPSVEDSENQFINEKIPLDDSEVILDSFGENFQKAKSGILAASRYMEKNCEDVITWKNWRNLPMKYCRYSLLDKQAEVLMLNPGIRRLTLWLQNACDELANNFQNCMEKTFARIINQSGAQFPIAGVVLEDMDGNRIGNSYAFRNGVTVKVDAFSSGTETALSSTQISKAFTDTVRLTFTFARPVSATREQITPYAIFTGLSIPDLGTSAERLNNYNVLVGDLYRKAWHSAENHIIRAWVFSQNF